MDRACEITDKSPQTYRHFISFTHRRVERDGDEDAGTELHFKCNRQTQKNQGWNKQNMNEWVRIGNELFQKNVTWIVRKKPPSDLIMNKGLMWKHSLFVLLSTIGIVKKSQKVMSIGAHENISLVTIILVVK